MQKIIAANWKMHKTRGEAAQTAKDLAAALAEKNLEGRQVLVFPPFTAIADVAAAFAGKEVLAVGGQNCYPAEQGAYTGEISPGMLRDAGASWVLTGHSERRHVLGESDAFVADKTAFALAHGLKVMLCVGETLDERVAGRLHEVLSRQLGSAVGPLAQERLAGRLAIAYEPVWAIGTGKVAGPEEVLEAHAETRRLLTEFAGADGSRLPILYGGSVKADNARMLIGLDNVDGLLVGGASLEAQSFAQIAGV
ncbi:triose-phosphate isomerase [Desulfovibrio sp. ZJ369]|uniref:triose-phosphate isomerase n=1 Tax=Desulfovibrio sp. ZJ369 TaxID=2709793 RepID=UPI0013ECEDF0|nr:triose-phosphate isomerase [Desulfovibrio sp. ZJ369]